MTIPRLQALNESWAEVPPLHVMVASFLGVQTPAKESGRLTTEEEARALAEQFGG
jgi:hypothetical protein